MSQVLHQKAAEEGMVGGSAQRKSTSASLGKDDSDYSLHLANDAKFITCELGIKKLCCFQVGLTLF